MFCQECGKELPDSAKFCSGCGQLQEPLPAKKAEPAAQPAVQPPVQGKPADSSPASALVGWSERIKDAAFQRYLRKSKRWSYIFAFILFGVAVVGFPIYGEKSGEVDMPQSLYYGLAIGGMFVVIAFLTNLKRSMDRSWDGVVVDKKVKKKVRQDSDSNMSTTYLVYETRIKRDSGKATVSRQQNNDTFYNYLQVGDRVRHHKGFSVFEKYDKSHDSHLFCIACAKRVEPTVDTCPRCKCPILK